MGEVGLEPTKPKGAAFTARSNCRYTTLPKEHHYATGRAGKKRLQMHPDYLVNGESRQQDLNPQPADYKSAALPIVLHRHMRGFKSYQWESNPLVGESNLATSQDNRCPYFFYIYYIKK